MEIRRERLKREADPMWFYDEESEEWQVFREEVKLVEREFHELRVLLRDTEEALRAAPGDDNLQARLRYLKKRLAELERQAPWLTADYPTEVLLWGVPHG